MSDLSKQRLSIRLAVMAMKNDFTQNMGDVMDLFALAHNAEEARILRDAYAEALVADQGVGAGEAQEIAEANIDFGLSYMEPSNGDALRALYLAPSPSSENENG